MNIKAILIKIWKKCLLNIMKNKNKIKKICEREGKGEGEGEGRWGKEWDS